MTLLAAAGLAAGVIAILIGLAVFRLRNHPFSLERFRPQLEEILSDRIAPLHATVGNLSATGLRWSGIEITARDTRLISDDGHVWVSFAKITFFAPLSTVVSPRRLETFTGPWLFSGAVVDALQPHSPFEALHGIATATGDALQFNIAGGRRGKIAVATGVVILEGLEGARTQANISFHCTASAGDALQVVTTAPLDLISRSVVPGNPAEGTVEADVHLKFTFDDLPAMEYHTRTEIRDLHLPQVLAGQNLTEGRFEVLITSDRTTVEGTARLGGIPATLRYSKPTGSQPETLKINTADIGALIASLKISGQLDGGRLTLNLDRHHCDEPWSGSVELGTTRVLQAPLLTRLLTMASLPGLLSILASDGLTVDHAQTEITIESGRISCQSIRISIDQLEITGHVNIALDAGHIEGEGLLIPAASLQRLVGNVPILGAFLEGIGKKNTPIVATRFTLSGRLSEPEITVFPVSSLAPDILKELGLV